MTKPTHTQRASAFRLSAADITWRLEHIADHPALDARDSAVLLEASERFFDIALDDEDAA